MATVLVIDDDALIRNTVTRMMRLAGHDAIEAADGRAGLEAIGQHNVDLVITDIIMPGQEGIETIVQIRALCSLPIIAMSGTTPSRDFNPLLDAELMGADAVIQKPFTAQALLATVGRLLRSEHVSLPSESP